MLRGFRQPYKKLFNGEVFTTVRVMNNHPFFALRYLDIVGRADKIGLYPRSKRYERLGSAEILSATPYYGLSMFESYCTEQFAEYDAELSKADFIKSLKAQAKRRKILDVILVVYTYLWTDKEDGYYEAKEGMQ